MCARILTVNSDEAHRRVLSGALRNAGFEVLEASSGDDALRLLVQKPRLVILGRDLRDINGLDLCRRIKKDPATASIPVLHISSEYVRVEERVRSLEGGADGYLPYPPDADELVASVRALLRTRQGEEIARTAARQWQTTFDAITDAVCLLDRDWNVVRCNRGMADLVRREFPGLIGRPYDAALTDALGAADPSAALMPPRTWAVAGDGALSAETAEVRFGERWLRQSVNPLQDEQGVLVGAVCVLAEITEGKRREEALRKSEELYRTLARNLPDGAVILFDGSFRCTLAEGYSLEGVALTREHLEGKALGDAVPAEMRERVEPLFRAALQGASATTEVPYAGRVLLLHTVPVRNDSGQVFAGMATIQDITQRKREEEHLRFLADVGRVLASSLDYEATLQRAAQMAVPHLADYCAVDLLTTDGTRRRLAVAHADPAIGLVVEELRTRFPSDPLEPRGMARVLRMGEPEIYPDFPDAVLVDVARNDEHLRLLRSLGFRSYMCLPLLARGRTLGAISFAVIGSGRRYGPEDRGLAEELAARAAMAIDSARLYQEAQEGAAERLRTQEALSYVLANARCLLWDAVVVEDPTHREGFRWDLRIYDEEAAQRFLPVQREEGESYTRAWNRSRLQEDMLHLVKASTQALRFGAAHYAQQYRCRRDDGAIRWLHEEVGLEQLAPGRWRLVGVCTDVTDRRNLEDDLRRKADELAEADQRKNEFLAVLAHELRNPLATVANAGYVLEHVPPDDRQAPELRATITRQTAHLSRLVDDLLDISRITRGKIRLQKEPVRLALMVRRALETTRLLVEGRGHAVEVSLPGGDDPETDPFWLEADPTRLEQVLVNLISNAAKYTDPGGHIRIAAALEGERPQTLVLTVSDDGIGIRPEMLPRVFEPFVQSARALERSQGGMGIGLTLVRSLVRLHGGEVFVHSDGLGKGTEFTVRLPALAEAPKVSRERGADAGLPARVVQLKVLLVEDDPDAAETLAEILELWGHDVEHAATGATALELAARYRPDVALIDIGLPDIDGYEVARRLRDLPAEPAPLLVALTGYSLAEAEGHTGEAGFAIGFTKPIRPAELRRVLDRAATGRGPSAAGQARVEG